MKTLSLLILTITSLTYALSPKEIVKKADAIRNPASSYRMIVSVDSSEDDAKEFEVLIQGNARTVIRTKSPARDKGRNLLMLEEDMWSYIPNLKRAVRVSLSQKLTGQTANGDISRMRWADDYDAKIESETKDHWVMHLKAKKKGLTYEQLRVWIHKNDFHPIKAEYLSVGGKVLKNAKYEGYKMLAGINRPTEIVIQDAIKETDRSTIHILEMESREFPAALFQQSNLGKTE